METENKIILTLYYMGKMCEGGLAVPVTGGGALSAAGFDAAMDLIDAGAKLEKDDIMYVLDKLNLVDDDDLEKFADIMLEIQEQGFKEVMRLVKDVIDGQLDGN